MQFAAEDKKRKEEVDVHNAADQIAYQTEKTISDLGDKASADEKSDLEAKLNALKEANKGTDLEAIKAKQQELEKAFYEVSAKIYQQQAPQGGAPNMGGQDMGGQNPGAQAGSADFVDADFKDVTDEDKK